MSQRIEYNFSAYNWTGVLAKIGGFLNAVIFTMGFLGFSANERSLIAKQIRNLYFVKASEKERFDEDGPHENESF